MSILRAPVGLNECAGVLKELRWDFGVLKLNIRFQNIDNLAVGSQGDYITYPRGLKMVELKVNLVLETNVVHIKIILACLFI